MKQALPAMLFLTVIAGFVCAQHTEAPPLASQPVRFAWLDIYLDSHDQPLAVYQCELKTLAGDVKIVGIEGGEHAAFAEPPYYDPAALSNNRVILAAFNTGKDLPTGKTRVARVHLRIAGPAQPEYAIHIEVAAGADGQQTPVAASFQQGAAQ